MTMIKTVQITERVRAELRADAFNLFNHPAFWPGDQNINSSNFGVIGGTLTLPRIMQFGLHVKF
jgi:hypothetical protein